MLAVHGITSLRNAGNIGEALMASSATDALRLVGVLLHLVFAGIAHPAFAQRNADTTERNTHVAGAVTITNNGISLLPALTLGKPAGILDVAIWRGGLSFEPQFRVALEGKPWSFIFWLRYRSPSSKKLHLVVGAHPAVVFRTITVST